MSTHIYAFGSVCRGDVSLDSDVDLLAIVDGRDERFNLDIFSVYSAERIHALWNEGNPFAWHLALEARLLFSTEPTDLLSCLGNPKPYQKCADDCTKFANLFDEAHGSLLSQTSSTVFDLSMVFLSIRNIATCFSLGITEQPTFSRRSALELGRDSTPLSEQAYQVLERARVLCTRGYGPGLMRTETQAVLGELPAVKEWMTNLVRRVEEHE
ncbi:MAG: nucleotidyltransferase domain-containing protein [Pseudomonadota bacterium]